MIRLLYDTLSSLQMILPKESGFWSPGLDIDKYFCYLNPYFYAMNISGEPGLFFS